MIRKWPEIKKCHENSYKNLLVHIFYKESLMLLKLFALKLIFHIRLNKGFLFLARLKCAAIN